MATFSPPVDRFHDLGLPCHAGYAQRVVGGGRRHASHRGAMAVDVGGVGVVVVEVIAGHHLRGQVGVRAVHARIQDRDDHAGALGGVPGGGGAHLVEVPFAAHVGIVADEVGGNQAVQFGELDMRVPVQALHHGFFRSIARQFDHMQVALADLLAFAAVRSQRLGELGFAQAGARHDQDAAAGVLFSVAGSRLRRDGCRRLQGSSADQHGRQQESCLASQVDGALAQGGIAVSMSCELRCVLLVHDEFLSKV